MEQPRTTPEEACGVKKTFKKTLILAQCAVEKPQNMYVCN